MSAKLDERRLKLAAQGLRKTAISLQAAVVSLLQTAEALTAETDDNLEHNPLEVNLQDLLKGDIHGALSKLLSDILNTENEALDDRKAQNGKQAANGVKKSPRKPRPPRDPNAPTKPQNAYIFFQKDVASQVKAENQGKPWSEIVHLISTRWKNLPKEERVIYDQKLEEAKQRYEIDLKAYMKRKDQEIVADADGAEGHEDNNISDSATQNSAASITSHSDDENEENEEDTLNISNARSSRSKAAKSAKTSQPDPESSSKKKSKKRKSHEDDNNESVHEEEEYGESPKKLKKKISNEEGDDVQGKERRKLKKGTREDEDLDIDGGKSKKKRNKKKKQD